MNAEFTGDDRRQSIESRVATHDAQISALTRDIRDLTDAVREQGTRVEGQIASLLVAVEKAQAPRRTDWGVLISAVGLILAIGMAALGPAFWRLGRLEAAEVRAQDDIHAHERLELHPVGHAKIAALEKDLAKNLAELDVKLQTETSLLTDSIKDQVASLRAEFADVKQNGSPITRERLAVIEERQRAKDGSP